ncbi:hypothetical protein DOY81_000428 [Sarcophaga bullata]|nr:hypothetical protein DOY81_000428 [Sarcophaga bullata]
MYLKFLLIYSYFIVNHAECTILSATRSRSNFALGIGARYRAPAFKSTPLKPVNPWPNANTYPNAPPRPSVWNTVSAPKPVIQSRWPPYNPHYNTAPKPVIQNDWPYAKQPAFNPHFKVPPTPTPANRNLGLSQRQPPYNPHFKELSGQTIQNNDRIKPPSSTNRYHPKQPAYDLHFKPPTLTTVNRNLGSSQRQPPYSLQSKRISGPITLNQGSMQRQPRQNPLMSETSTIKSHVQSTILTLYPLMTTGDQSKNEHGKNVASKFAGILGALHTFVKKLTKNHHSTNVKQTYENPILLSPEDVEDKFAVKNLINTYSPQDSNPFNLRQSLQKGVISNKLPTIHRHNLETKNFYKGKPFILVAIVVSSVVAMTAITGGIMFYFKNKN